MFSSRRKLKKSLTEAEDQIKSLKEQVRALEDTNELLSSELAESKGVRNKSVSFRNILEDVLEEKEPVLVEKEQAPLSACNDGELQNPVDDEATAQNQELDNANDIATASEAEGGSPAIEKDDATLDIAKASSADSVGVNENGQLQNTGDCLLVPFSQESDETSNTTKACENDSLPQTPSSDANDDDNKDPQQIITKLTQRNQELEANVASLSTENSNLTTRLAKEKNRSMQRKTEAKERRKKFEDKLANMSEQLKEDFSAEDLVDGGVV